MRITTAMRKAINQKARETMRFGPFGHVEVRINFCTNADHAEHQTFDYRYYNQVFYDIKACEPDLDDLRWLRDLKEVEDHPSGRVELDLYVYSRPSFTGSYRHYVMSDSELDHNLLAVFQDGELQSIEGNP